MGPILASSVEGGQKHLDRNVETGYSCKRKQQPKEHPLSTCDPRPTKPESRCPDRISFFIEIFKFPTSREQYVWNSFFFFAFDATMDRCW